jgi:GrpB protein
LVGVIVVADYDPAWPGQFERLRREYAQAMAAAGGPVVAIEHAGSTSVPGPAAKPLPRTSTSTDRVRMRRFREFSPPPG